MARALVLSNSYWAIMSKIVYLRTAVLNKMTCADWFISAAKFPSRLVRVSFCISFGNLKITLNNPNPTSSLCSTFAELEYLDLVIYIFIDY